MPNEIPISQLTAGNSKATDLYVAVDTTDTTQAPSGTTKQYIFVYDVNYILARLGLNVIGYCKYATTAALTAVYNNGAAGVGATLTNSGAQAALQIDGVSATGGDRILVKNQASSLQNGVYTVTNPGSPTTNWILTRATDFDTSGEILNMSVTMVTLGSTNSNQLYQCTVTNPVNVGTDPITFGLYALSSGSVPLPVSLANGGTNNALVADNGGIVYSDGSKLQILAHTTVAGKMFQSGASGAPSWSVPTYPSVSATAGKILISDGTNNVYSVPTYPSASGSAGQIIISDGTNNNYSTATYPATTTINQILYSSAGNTVTGLATANSSVLVTSAGGVPSLSTTLPANLVTTDPTLTQGVATKNYVDQTALNGTSVYAATISNLNVTQAGAGVGATLTDASGTFAAFSVDGVSPAVGSNILVKNLAIAASHQGIYTLTRNGDGISVPYQLTRATSYDTAIEINNTGLVVVQNGTQAGQAWYNTATIVTVDTTNFNYNRYGQLNAINSVVQRIFTAGTSTYTPTTGMMYCTVELVGGGGGAGGAPLCANAGMASNGSAGGYAKKTYTATLIGANATVVVGAGGSGGAAGANNGTAGGNSTFTPAGAGVVLTCNGGGKGYAGSNTAGTQFTSTSADAGGTATNGDINITGGTGTTGQAIAGVSVIVGYAGDTPLSTLAATSLSGAGPYNGSNGTGYGSGGTAGISITSSAAASGGNGANGICIITEYVSV